jgi:hypothetical protein
MSFLNRIKPNKPVAGLEGYFVALLSKSKFGKTTFVYDLINEYYNGDYSKAILLGAEIGYKTLDGIHAVAITDYNKTSDEEKDEMGNFGFIEMVNDLIANKKEHGYRMVVIDTITALERLATKYMLSVESVKIKKRLTDISDIPFGGGYTKLAEVLYTQIERLKRSGFSVWVVGHEKTKTVTLKDGTEYNLTTLNCQGKTIDIIEREADMIIYGDLIKKVVNGEMTETRQLRFRSDGNIICGSRFRAMPDFIDLDVKVFLETFKEAVLASFDGDEKAVEVAVKEQEIERESLGEAAVNNDASPTLTPDQYIIEIGELIGKMDEARQADLKKQFKEANNSVNYKKYTEIEQFERALEIAKKILG